MRLFSAATPAQQAVLDQPYYDSAHSAVLLSLTGIKFADNVISYGLAGRLYLSKSGWMLLQVPNAIGRGAFDALYEQGVELPTRDTNDPNEVFNAHISVMSKKEVDSIGIDKITERGHTFRYTLGPVREITPKTWDGVSKVWAIECYSPELKNLRKSYGLNPLPGPNGDYNFHITFAIRRTNALRLAKAANGDELAFKAWKAHGLSDEEADRRAGEGLELPVEKKITPIIRNQRTKVEDFDICPHCNEEIGEKASYMDPEGYVYHRPCMDAGPINRYKLAGINEDIDAAAAECEEPKSKEQAEAGNYRHGHCRLHGMGITIETGKGMTRKGTSKSGKAWSITMAHHYGYIKRTESEADGDHVDVFIGPDAESDTVYVVDQYLGDKFDEHKCMLGFKNKADAKAGYLECYDPNWKGFGGITALTIKQFRDWVMNGDTRKPLAEQELFKVGARLATKPAKKKQKSPSWFDNTNIGVAGTLGAGALTATGLAHGIASDAQAKLVTDAATNYNPRAFTHGELPPNQTGLTYYQNTLSPAAQLRPFGQPVGEALVKIRSSPKIMKALGTEPYGLYTPQAQEGGGGKLHYRAFAAGPVPAYMHQLYGRLDGVPVPAELGVPAGTTYANWMNEKLRAFSTREGNSPHPLEYTTGFMPHDQQKSLMERFHASLSPAEQAFRIKTEDPGPGYASQTGNYLPKATGLLKARSALKDVGIGAGGAAGGALGGSLLYKLLNKDEDETSLGHVVSTTAGAGLGGGAAYLFGTDHGRETLNSFLAALRGQPKTAGVNADGPIAPIVNKAIIRRLLLGAANRSW